MLCCGSSLRRSIFLSGTMRRSLLRPLQASIHACRPRPLPAFRSNRPVLPAIRTLVSAAECQFGQPLHETHPHLIAPGDLTPGISALEYHHRRAALASKLPKNSIAILASNDLKYRSGAVFYEFHQEPNFYYLTGFNEPDSIAVIEKGETDVEYTFHLFVRPKDEKAEIWDGARSGVQAAQDVFNADEAQSIESLSSLLPQIINGAREVFTDIGSYTKKTAVEKFILGDGTGVEGMQKALSQTGRVRQLRPLMNEIRLKKSNAELNNMRRAGAASGFVITQAMTRDYTTEKQLWADLAYGFRSHGLDGDAYVPVVAGGQNGLSIHYVRNDCPLRSGETVLVDAGGEYGGYVADITRTWPVDKTFTPAQRDMYAMLLETQKNVVEMCKESANLSLDRLHRITDNMLRDGLKDLGFDVSGRNMEQLFPHHVGHFVGLDVHDAPGHPRTGALVEGNCITIEPGVYVPDDERWPERFRGLAMRVEDSVVIGKDAPEVLTATAAKEIDEIEALRAGR